MSASKELLFSEATLEIVLYLLSIEDESFYAWGVRLKVSCGNQTVRDVFEKLERAQLIHYVSTERNVHGGPRVLYKVTNRDRLKFVVLDEATRLITNLERIATVLPTEMTSMLRESSLITRLT